MVRKSGVCIAWKTSARYPALREQTKTTLTLTLPLTPDQARRRDLKGAGAALSNHPLITTVVAMGII